jgi:hypothetical protein
MKLFKRIKDPGARRGGILRRRGLRDLVMTTADSARLHADQLAAELRGEAPQNPND